MAVRNRTKKYDVALKYEKKVIEDLVKQRLFSRAGEITDALVARALEGDVTAIKESYDRMFGKAKQTLDLETDNTPIVFMPAVLVNKFSLDVAKATSEDKDENTKELPAGIPTIYEHEGSI